MASCNHQAQNLRRIDGFQCDFLACRREAKDTEPAAHEDEDLATIVIRCQHWLATEIRPWMGHTCQRFQIRVGQRTEER